MVFTDITMEFNRSTCDCPGPITMTGPNSLVHYLAHPSGTALIAAWWPKISFQLANWMLFLRGGLGYNPGERSSFDIGAMGGQQIAQYFASKGYVVFSIDYPGVSSNKDSGLNFDEIHPLAMWPEQVQLVIAAIQFIRDNYLGTSATRYGTRLLGAGNSINPRNGVTWGTSWGATLGMMAGLTPDGDAPSTSVPHASYDPSAFHSSHRLLCYSGFQGQLDFCQLDIEPLGLDAKPTYPLGEIYMNDRAQFASRVESRMLWSETPVEDKKISPAWMFERNLPENSQTSFFLQWRANNPAFGQPGYIPEEGNLGPEHFVLGKLPTQTARDNGIQQRDPHHNFQAKWLRDKLLTYGPEGSLIRKSVVRWGTGGKNGTNPGAQFLTGDSFALDLHTHLVNNCGFGY